MLQQLHKQAKAAMLELLAAAKLAEGDVVVLGCSTSEVAGQKLGTASSPDIASILMEGLLPPVREAGLHLAIQCCEHLNRALVVEGEVQQRMGLVRVNALPRPKAGGSMATAAFGLLRRPVVVQGIQAAAGLDIGLTLIGMHLRPVAVPVRLATAHIGQAPVAAARTRPPFIGGARAEYQQDLL